MPFRKPLLPESFLTWTEPPDEAGDEALRIVSWRRALTVKGHSFREFVRSVAPRLDGKTDMNALCAEVADTFARSDLEAALAMLGAQGIVVEGDPTDAPPRLAPQLAWLGEAAPDGRAAQRRLTGAGVAIFGAGGPGAAAARILAASGVGRILIVDPAEVGPADPYFSPLYLSSDLGRPRAEVLAARLVVLAPEVEIVPRACRPETPAEIAELLDGAALALCCFESGELNLTLKLNRACRDISLRWLAGSMEGTDLVIGPGFSGAPDAACYMCWRMREVACAANPEARFALEKRLDRIRADLSARRENLAGAADIVGGMLATEAISLLTGAGEPSFDGRFLTLELPGLRQEKHAVLRKPGCPVCGGDAP